MNGYRLPPPTGADATFTQLTGTKPPIGRAFHFHHATHDQEISADVPLKLTVADVGVDAPDLPDTLFLTAREHQADLGPVVPVTKTSQITRRRKAIQQLDFGKAPPKSFQTPCRKAFAIGAGDVLRQYGLPVVDAIGVLVATGLDEAEAEEAITTCYAGGPTVPDGRGRLLDQSADNEARAKGEAEERARKEAEELERELVIEASDKQAIVELPPVFGTVPDALYSVHEIYEPIRTECGRFVKLYDLALGFDLPEGVERFGFMPKGSRVRIKRKKFLSGRMGPFVLGEIIKLLPESSQPIDYCLDLSTEEGVEANEKFHEVQRSVDTFYATHGGIQHHLLLLAIGVRALRLRPDLAVACLAEHGFKLDPSLAEQASIRLLKSGPFTPGEIEVEVKPSFLSQAKAALGFDGLSKKLDFVLAGVDVIENEELYPALDLAPNTVNNRKIAAAMKSRGFEKKIHNFAPNDRRRAWVREVK